MEVTREQVVAMARAVSLEIPEADLENVRLRLSTLRMTTIDQLGRLVHDEREEDEPADRHVGVLGRLLEERQHVVDLRQEERGEQRPHV